MTSICIKYSGLKFNYIFETKDFIFIPIKEEEEGDISEIEDIFSCKYDKSSNFYVLLEESGEIDFTLEEFSEENLYKFKLLEAILNLLFSNYMKRDCIFILEKVDSEFTIKKIFKNLSKDIITEKPTLLWKNQIIIKFLQELINVGFDKFNTIDQKDDFALRYFFCVDMYLRGKFEENRLRYISDLWISLEILSVITISHILHSHESFKVENFFDELKESVKEYSSMISDEKIDCWPKMKDKFTEHMKNKINDFLPIFQKCVMVAEEYININDIKVKFKEESEFEDPAKYLNYINVRKDFKDYQDVLTIKNILNNFYDYRNKLFHGGKILERWSLKSDRHKANFIKLLEQLLFRVLGIDMISFYQMGYPHQWVFGIPKVEGTIMDLGNLSRNTESYIDKYCIEPLITDFKIHFQDLKIARENYINKKHRLEPLRSQLNSCMNEVLTFLNDNHPTQLVIEGRKYNHLMNYQDIKDRKIDLILTFSSGIYGDVCNKTRVKIKNQDITNITTTLVGMFDDDNIRYGKDMSFVVPFLINPPYISFEFN